MTAGRSPTAISGDARDATGLARVAYPGGKSGTGVYQTIINHMPPHRTYVEPFAGGGAILRIKRPAHENIAIDLDPGVANHWRGVDWLRFETGCGIAWLETQGPRLTADDLVYCDPPYLMRTRRSQVDLYACEMSDADHRRLLAITTRLHCRVMISGYWSHTYEHALCRWRVLRYQAMTRGGGPATEYLWMNYAAPAALHDYRYIGDDYRERERIKKKVGRWRRRFADLPELEAQALMSALHQLHETRHRPGSNRD